MNYQTCVSEDGSLPLGRDIVRAIGMAPGDRVIVDTADGAIVVKRDDNAEAAADRLRAAFGEYSVEQFLHERRADRHE